MPSGAFEFQILPASRLAVAESDDAQFRGSARLRRPLTLAAGENRASRRQSGISQVLISTATPENL